jgi:metal-responsive CopG/Arc/MetJ family transcriptional regulator
MNESEIPNDRTRANIWFTKKMYLSIQNIAQVDGRSISDVLREAARDYVQKHQERIQIKKED